MRQHVHPRDLPFSSSQLPGNLNVGAFPERNHFRPYEPRQRCPVRQRDSHNDAQKSPPTGEGNQNQQKHVGNPHDQVDERPQNHVSSFPEKRRGQSHRQRHHGAERRRQKPQPDTHGQPRQRADKHIPPHKIRSEQMPRRRQLILNRKIRGRCLFCANNSCNYNY